MEILTFLKGRAMKILFNKAQLSRHQRESLFGILDVLQSENDSEIEVTVVEFPFKLKVKLDDGIEMLLGWDVEKDGYAGLTKPESEKDTVDLPGPESLTETKPEPELDLSPVIVRVEALARAFVNLAKPCDTDQRIELMIRVFSVLYKEL